MTARRVWARAWVASEACLAHISLPAASQALLQQVAEAARGSPSPQRLLRRRLLSALAASALGMHPSEVQLVAGNDGIRRLAGRDVYASVASRPGWVAVALAGQPVGVDIELVREAAAAPALAQEGLDHNAGEAWLSSAGIWAAKEAYLKSLGKGLAAAEQGWRFGPCGAIQARGLPTHHAMLRSLPEAVAALVVDGMATPPLPRWLDHERPETGTAMPATAGQYRVLSV